MAHNKASINHCLIRTKASDKLSCFQLNTMTLTHWISTFVAWAQSGSERIKRVMMYAHSRESWQWFEFITTQLECGSTVRLTINQECSQSTAEEKCGYLRYMAWEWYADSSYNVFMSIMMCISNQLGLLYHCQNVSHGLMMSGNLGPFRVIQIWCHVGYKAGSIWDTDQCQMQ